MMFYLDRLTAPAFVIAFMLAAGAPLCPAPAGAAGCHIVAPGLPDGCPTRAVGSGLMVLAQAAAQSGDLTAEQRARLKAEVARVPSDLRGRFDVRYRAWK